VCVCLSVSVSVCSRMPTLFHGPGCNLGEWYGMPLVLHYWTDLQSVHGLRCYRNTRNAWQSPALIRRAHRTPHALRMPAKTSLASDKKIDAPVACATLSATRPFHFVHTAGVIMRTRNVSELLALCLVYTLQQAPKGAIAACCSRRGVAVTSLGVSTKLLYAGPG